MTVATASPVINDVFQLTLATDYCPDWGTWEGVRELIQNALDSEQDLCPKEIHHDGNSLLSVANHGAKLERKVWLLGTTTKTDGSYRGCFGEGLKLGVLALVRAGHRVVIYNHEEIWTPSLQPSVQFESVVLTITVTPNPFPDNELKIQVGGISAKTWKRYTERFLSLTSAKKSTNTYLGEILPGAAHRGRLYVRGIFVQDITDYKYGYNFTGVRTDRDRSMVNSWELNSYAARTWIAAAEAEIEAGRSRTIVRALFDLIVKGAPDVTSLDVWIPRDSKIAEELCFQFQKRFGDRSLPAESDLDAREIERMAMTPVRLPRKAVEALRCCNALTMEQARAAYSTMVAEVHPIASLSERELENYETALRLLCQPAADLHLPDPRESTQVVSFKAEEVLGIYDPLRRSGSLICLARKCLLDLEQTVRTLAHEVAHYLGGDGEDMHQRTVERLLSKAICLEHQRRLSALEQVRAARRAA